MSPEIRGIDIDMNKIKDVIGYMRDNNVVYDWMNSSLPVKIEDEDIPHVADDKFPEMEENAKKMHWYQEQLREAIPPILKKIEKEYDRLG